MRSRFRSGITGQTWDHGVRRRVRSGVIELLQDRSPLSSLPVQNFRLGIQGALKKMIRVAHDDET
jgi:hypothetical protein